jgi:hypothetical protein
MIEQVTQPQIQHEADLRGALKNTGPEGAGTSNTPAAKPSASNDNAAPPSSNAVPAATPPASTNNIPPGATPLPKLSEALDSNNYGTDKDYQLVRAIDLLRGVTLFKSMAAAQ